MSWKAVHRWLGLTLGTVAVVLGITGALLAIDPASGEMLGAALVQVVQMHAAPKARASSTNMRHAASTRSTAASQKRPVASTPSPKSVISVCLDDSTIAPASTCANTSRDDTVPRSIAATL